MTDKGCSESVIEGDCAPQDDRRHREAGAGKEKGTSEQNSSRVQNGGSGNEYGQGLKYSSSSSSPVTPRTPDI